MSTEVKIQAAIQGGPVHLGLRALGAKRWALAGLLDARVMPQLRDVPPMLHVKHTRCRYMFGAWTSAATCGTDLELMIDTPEFTFTCVVPPRLVYCSIHHYWMNVDRWPPLNLELVYKKRSPPLEYADLPLAILPST